MIRRGILVWTAIALFVGVVSIGARHASATPAGGDPQAATGQTTKPSTAKPATAKPAAPQGTATSKPAAPARPVVPASPGAGPVIVVEMQKGGVFEFETYPKEAPKTVAHILALVKKRFYDGLRVHRVEPGFVIQFGDPYTTDMSKVGLFGTGGSGRSIGALESSPAHPHKVGAVAMAHAGDPSAADSQMYIALTLERTRNLDGMYTVFGQVISGMGVVQKIAQNDVIRRVTVRGDTPAAKK